MPEQAHGVDIISRHHIDCLLLYLLWNLDGPRVIKIVPLDPHHLSQLAEPTIHLVDTRGTVVYQVEQPYGAIPPP